MSPRQWRKEKEKENALGASRATLTPKLLVATILAFL
jgi:hypothetical protein